MMILGMGVVCRLLEIGNRLGHHPRHSFAATNLPRNHLCRGSSFQLVLLDMHIIYSLGHAITSLWHEIPENT